MPHLVHLLSSNASTAVDERFRRLAEFCGARCEKLSPEGTVDFQPSPASGVCLAASAEALRDLCRSRPGILERILSQATQVLVFGLSHGDSELLETCLGVHVGIEAFDGGDDCRVRVGDERSFSGCLSGRSFTTRLRDLDSCFTLRDTPATVLLSAADHPLCLKLRAGQADCYLLTASCGDLDLPERDTCFCYSRFPSIFPFLMFLHRALGAYCWQSPVPAANLVIDDPYLKSRYGWLDFPALAGFASARDNFGFTVAFIPFNYRRSDPGVAALFRDSAGKLSLCVHGCDHTWGEFDQSDEEQLSGRIVTARERMRHHEQRFGVPWDKVMVFPQGLFSSQAPVSLGRAGFLAAVNSTLTATDRTAGLPRCDFLAAACTAYDGVPLFSRVYPEPAVELAFALFLGKPLIIVEHHHFFQSGLERLEQLLDEVAALEPAATWLPLGELLERSCQQRLREGEPPQYRIFTDRFRFAAGQGPFGSCRVVKPERHPTGIAAVLVNGEPVEYTVADGLLEFELDAPGGGETLIEVERRREAALSGQAGHVYSFSERSGILVRRLLCDLRDNVIDRNRRLSSLVAAVRRRR